MKQFLIPISVAVLVLAGLIGVLVGPEARWQYRYHTGSEIVKQVMTIEKEYGATILGILHLDDSYISVFVEAVGTREGRELTLDLLNLMNSLGYDDVKVYIIVSVHTNYYGIAEMDCRPMAYTNWDDVVANCWLYPWYLGDVRPLLNR